MLVKLHPLRWILQEDNFAQSGVKHVYVNYQNFNGVSGKIGFDSDSAVS